MKTKFVCIVICMLLILTSIPALGNIVDDIISNHKENLNSEYDFIKNVYNRKKQNSN